MKVFEVSIFETVTHERKARIAVSKEMTEETFDQLLDELEGVLEMPSSVDDLPFLAKKKGAELTFVELNEPVSSEVEIADYQEVK